MLTANRLPIFIMPSLAMAMAALPEFPMTFHEMEVKAGYYTENGKYLGGIPKADSISHEFYRCQNFNLPNKASNVTACMEWKADELFGEELEGSTCKCRSLADDSYCSEWTCCSTDSCSIDAVYCQCDAENGSGLFCDSWSCSQIDSKESAEYEQYTCLETSDSGKYCDAWNGKITASEEIEVVACRCLKGLNGDHACPSWECKELGLSHCASSGGNWCNIVVSVGVGGGFGLIGVICLCVAIQAISDGECDKLLIYGLLGIFGILWCSLWAAGVVIWGGADGALYVRILWGVPIAWTLIVSAGCPSCLEWHHYSQRRDRTLPMPGGVER